MPSGSLSLHEPRGCRSGVLAACGRYWRRPRRLRSAHAPATMPARDFRGHLKMPTPPSLATSHNCRGQRARLELRNPAASESWTPILRRRPPGASEPKVVPEFIRSSTSLKGKERPEGAEMRYRTPAARRIHAALARGYRTVAALRSVTARQFRPVAGVGLEGDRPSAAN